MAAQGASGGFVVASGSYTDDAKEFAKGRNIQLVDGGSRDGGLREISVRRNRDVSEVTLKVTPHHQRHLPVQFVMLGW
ncbi:restriction endonuclease [Pseudomonas sp.]|uniref:restriction endonuclease n=1 Tax=unclassified Pseudomonas TaxID=196821 RepID=UPI0031E066B6